MKMFETIFIICLEYGVVIYVYLEWFWERMSDMFSARMNTSGIIDKKNIFELTTV